MLCFLDLMEGSTGFMTEHILLLSSLIIFPFSNLCKSGLYQITTTLQHYFKACLKAKITNINYLLESLRFNHQKPALRYVAYANHAQYGRRKYVAFALVGRSNIFWARCNKLGRLDFNKYNLTVMYQVVAVKRTLSTSA